MAVSALRLQSLVYKKKKNTHSLYLFQTNEENFIYFSFLVQNCFHNLSELPDIMSRQCFSGWCVPTFQRKSQLVKSLIRGLDDEFHGLNDNCLGLDGKLHGLNDKLHGLNEKLHGLNDKLHGLNEKLHGLNDKEHGLDEFVMHWIENSMIEMINTKV